MRIVGYAALALAAIAMDAEAIENETPKTASAEGVAWEIAWSVAMFEHLASSRWERDSSDARKIYGNAWLIYKRARAIYEADRDGHVAVAGENLLFVMQLREQVRLKYDAAIRAEIVARIAAADAARSIYETGRTRDIAAWENYRAVLQTHIDALKKRDAAYKAERAARRAVRDAVSEARSAANSAVEKANRATRRR